MKRKNDIVLLFGFLLISFFVKAQQQVYSKVKVYYDTAVEIERLASLGFDIDHPEIGKDNSIGFFVNEDELRQLEYQQFDYEIVIPDYRAFYATMVENDQPKLLNMTRSNNVADGFGLGSMGGFYTLAEVEAKLDEMLLNYPNLVTPKTNIGNSLEGRPIWMVKISDNPNIDEPEPAAYFDGLHHAREPLSMATNINYMFWLLENYDTDPAVQFLVNNRELYFVPVVNPDGYVHNEQIDPNGVGLWRKNRRNSPGGCIGVDLNRNYSFGYNHNSDCSSGDPCSNTYRGTGPFSEPETTVISNFLAQIEPKMGFSIHSTAGSYLMPFGFDTSPPAFGIFSEWASAFLNENDYPYGVTFQMLGYTSCGTTRDYFFSEGIYGWTPEIDGDGFWPTPSTIFDLVGENVRPMYYQSWIAGAYLDVQSHTQLGDALIGSSFDLIVEVKNVGVGAGADVVSVVLEASSPFVSVSTASGYGTVLPREKKDNSSSPFTIEIDPSFPDSSFTLTASTYQDGVLNEIEHIPVLVGDHTVLFYDDAENGPPQWIAGGNGMSWGQVDDDSYSGDFSYGDSNGGNSENNSLNFFELDLAFDFTGLENPVITYAAKWSIEEDDRAAFQVSIDGGTNWTDLREYTTNNDWKNEVVLLDDFTGFSDVRFRFELITDNFLPGDGFYFDDFRILEYDTEILDSGQILEQRLAIFPNPFKDEFTIELGGHYSGYSWGVKLYDLQGRVIPTEEIHSDNSIKLSVTGTLARGVYFLKVIDRSENTVLTRKLIKI